MMSHREAAAGTRAMADAEHSSKVTTARPVADLASISFILMVSFLGGCVQSALGQALEGVAAGTYCLAIC